MAFLSEPDGIELVMVSDRGASWTPRLRRVLGKGRPRTHWLHLGVPQVEGNGWMDTQMKECTGV